MMDLLKRGILTGIGIASLTKDKIEELAEKIIEESKLSEEEGRKLVERRWGMLWKSLMSPAGRISRI
jgi:polyhydroxyalkanoate synthesis regulator phasin